MITTSEVINKSPVRREYPTTVLCQIIDDYEKHYIEECFGTDFYEALLESLNDYSAVSEYNNRLTYSQNDLVLLDGKIYISKINSNNSVPTTTNWELAPKFDDELLNEFWKIYVKFLAYQLISKTLTYTTYQLGAKGATEFTQDDTGIRSVDDKKLVKIEQNLVNDSKIFFKATKEFCIKNKSTSPFNLIIFLKDEECNDCDVKRRRSRKVYIRK